MKRIKLTVAYDGTEYSGWQIQPNANTIEQELDHAIQQISGEHIHVTGASRTDAGVHAMGNVAVFDTNASIPGERWAYALNAKLPEQISIVESRQVSDSFHPRHCNTQKTYEYRILNTRFAIPQWRNYSWHINQELDLDQMKKAAGLLIGEHDFKSFCCVRTTVESTVRTIYDVEIEPTPVVAFSQNKTKNDSLPNEQMVTIRIRGNGFLYNMVRIIAGTLVQVGKGQKTVEDVAQMLAAKDRCSAGQTAPPQGLTLMCIDYVDKDDEMVNECG